MRTLISIIAAALLVLGAAACGGGGTDGKKVENRRDPAGTGETRGPDVNVRPVNALRRSNVFIRDGRFHPQVVSLKLDNTVRFVNEDDKAHTLIPADSTGPTFRPAKVGKGSSFERSFLTSGRVTVEAEDDPSLRMTITVSR